jgi:hypothetical protein
MRLTIPFAHQHFSGNSDVVSIESPAEPRAVGLMQSPSRHHLGQIQKAEP